jgi:hypothetical protein
MQILGQQARRLYELALANPLLDSPVAGLRRRILRRRLGPLQTAAENPQHTIQSRPRVVLGRQRLSARRAGRKIDSTNSHCSSINSQRAAIQIRGDDLSNSSYSNIGTRIVNEMGSNLQRRLSELIPIMTNLSSILHIIHSVSPGRIYKAQVDFRPAYHHV